jgi:hypothetical protein
MRSEFAEMLDGFLREGDDDDIYFGEVINEISNALGFSKKKKLSQIETEALWREISDFVALMLDSGFVAISHFSGQPGKIEIWPNQSPAAVMEKIKKKWIEYEGKTPEVWFLVWFRKTAPPTSGR